MSESNTPKTYRAFSIEGWVFTLVGAFYIVTVLLYWFTSKEDAGTFMLLLAIFLGLIPGTYLLWWSRHMKPRPEDRDEATLEEGAGTVGAFPSSSIWPFVFGISAGFVALAFVFGVWLGILGGAGMTGAAIGYIAESRRGGYV